MPKTGFAACAMALCAQGRISAGRLDIECRAAVENLAWGSNSYSQAAWPASVCLRPAPRGRLQLRPRALPLTAAASKGSAFLGALAEGNGAFELARKPLIINVFHIWSSPGSPETIPETVGGSEIACCAVMAAKGAGKSIIRKNVDLARHSSADRDNPYNATMGRDG